MKMGVGVRARVRKSEKIAKNEFLSDVKNKFFQAVLCCKMKIKIFVNSR